MGGKGKSNSSAMGNWQQTPTGPSQDWKTQAMTQTATKKPAEPKPEPITEDPTTTTGIETMSQGETQPYAPPGWGNYGTGTNLSPLGDALVIGMQEQPGKPGPTTPKYTGQV